jgi:hypothetical protein
MSSTTFRNIVALFLFIHAIGHFQGVLVSVGVFSTETWHARSWLLDGLIGAKASQMLAVALWVISFVGFLGTALAFLGIGLPHEWWRTMAVIFAVPSLLGVILYWNSFAMFFNKVGALGINAAILIGLLILDWPQEAQLGF